MTQAQIIEAVLQAPPERLEAILLAARGDVRKPRPGTVRQAAEILGCSTRTVKRYAEGGLLNVIRISPRRVRYDLQQVENLAVYGVQQ